MSVGLLCGVAPCLFRKKSSGTQGRGRSDGNRNPFRSKKFASMKVAPVRDSCEVASNFVTMANLKNKITNFRDSLDFSPCNVSTSVNELLILTMKDIHKRYPNIGIGVSKSELKDARINKSLRLFCSALKSLGDLWTTEKWMTNCKYDPSKKVGHLELEQIALGLLDDLIKLAREKLFDELDEEEVMRTYSHRVSIFRKALSESCSDSAKSPLGSSATPTSVLPEVRKNREKGHCSPPLMSQTIQAVRKLSPIDIKRLSFYMLPHAISIAQENKQLDRLSKMEKGEERKLKETSEVKQDGMDKVCKSDGMMDCMDMCSEGGREPEADSAASKIGKSDFVEKVDDEGRNWIATADINLVAAPVGSAKQEESAPENGLMSQVLANLAPPSADEILSVPPQPPPLPPPPVAPKNLAGRPPSPSPPLRTSGNIACAPPPSPPPPPMAMRGSAPLRPPPLALPNDVPSSPPPPMGARTEPVPPPPVGASKGAVPPPPPPPPMGASNGHVPPTPPPSPNVASMGPVPPQPEPMVASTGPVPPPPPPVGASKGPVPPPPPPMGASRGPLPPPPPPVGAGPVPPPPPTANGSAPAPSPGAASLRFKKAATKLKRSSQMANMYRLLKGKVEGSSAEGKPAGRKGKVAAPAPGGKQGMADALAEMTKKSAYFQQIEEDIKNYTGILKELKVAISNFQTSDMNELVKFHKYVESYLEKLTDETQVLAKLEDFPSKKLETLRLAAALYNRLDGIVDTLREWPIVLPLSQLLDKAESYFNKIKVELDGLERTKEEELKKFQAQKINFDFGILVRIKELMVDVSSGCMELALKETRAIKAKEIGQPKDDAKNSKAVKMQWRAFQFAFRVYTFAGGQDDRADQLTKELAQEIETGRRVGEDEAKQ